MEHVRWDGRGDTRAPQDPVDQVRNLLQAGSLADPTDAALKTMLQKEMDVLLKRLRSVRDLSGHGGRIEMSPHVVELAQRMGLSQVLTALEVEPDSV